MIYISKYISYAEATRSTEAAHKGIKNDPDKEAIENMRRVAVEIFDRVRGFFGVPIKVNSFYRSPVVNNLVGGSATSDHVKGCAIDVKAIANSGITNKDIFEYVRSNCEYDQLIWEHGNNKQPAWVHFSKRAIGNRMQVLQAKKVNGKTVYVEY
jgi:hypothetical protein